MAVKDRDQLSRRDVPDPDRIDLIAAPGQEPPIRAERREAATFRRIEVADLGAIGRIPQHDRSFRTQSREQVRAGRAAGGPATPLADRVLDAKKRGIAGEIPRLDGAGRSRREKGSALVTEGQRECRKAPRGERSRAQLDRLWWMVAVPKLDLAIVKADRGHVAAIGSEGDVPELRFMAAQLDMKRSRGYVPDPDDPIPAARYQPPPIRAEIDPLNLAAVPAQRLRPDPRRRVIQADPTRERGAGQRLTVWAVDDVGEELVRNRSPFRALPSTCSRSSARPMPQPYGCRRD